MKKLIFILSLLIIPWLALAASNHDCGGTEPFWNLKITPSGMTFEVMGWNEKAKLVAVQPTPPRGFTGDSLQIFRTSRLDNKKPATVIIQKQSCNDGMSDNTYPYEVIYLSEEEAYYGCCRN